MSIFIPLAIVVVSGYICYRAMRRCEECADEWAAESDLNYSWPSLVQNYYGEGFDDSSGVGGQAELQGSATREAEVPVSDTPRPGDLLQESSGRSGRYFTLWRSGLPHGYECARNEGVPVIRHVQNGAGQDLLKLE